MLFILPFASLFCLTRSPLANVGANNLEEEGKSIGKESARGNLGGLLFALRRSVKQILPSFVFVWHPLCIGVRQLNLAGSSSAVAARLISGSLRGV